MDNKLTYYYDDIILCIICHKIFKINNYDKHLLSKNHITLKRKKHYKINSNNKYIIEFT